MKKTMGLIIAICLATSSYSQNLIDGAESVAYHPASDCYFVSSLNNNKVIKIDSHNQQTVFAENIIAFGNCIKGDTLFLSSGSYVNGININTGQIDFRVRVQGATQFDGMTYDSENNLYVVDSGSDKIVKINIATGSYSFFIEDGLENNIQDLIYNPFTDRILTCAYGASTYITSINPQTGENTKLIQTIGRFDGITIDNNGFVYLGTHANGGQVIMYSSDFLIGPILIQDGIEEPAGLDFNLENNTIAVPSFSGDKVFFLPLSDNFFYPAFTENAVSGHAPLEIDFSDKTRASFEPTSWKWDFNNDGIIDSREQNPTYTFSEPGIYSVSLIVDNINDPIAEKVELIHVFDGESSITINDTKAYINVSAASELNLTNKFSIEAYINLAEYPSTLVGATIIDKNSIRLYTTGNAFGTKSDSTIAVSLKLNNDSTVILSAPSGLLEVKKWMHVGFCYNADENNACFYINGTLYEAAPTGSISAEVPLVNNETNDIYLGNSSTTNSYLNGKIDEVRVWNSFRTPTDVISTLNHSLKGDEDSLAGFWSMNEGSGNVIIDNAENSNSGSIVSGYYRQGVDFPSITSVKEIDKSNELNLKFELRQNYPNPFNPSTQIKYRINNQAQVRLSVYNILGKKIIDLINSAQSPGSYSVEWNGKDINNQSVSTGIYFYELKVDQSSVVKKMTLLK